jgi:hypothetical protein
VQYSPNTSLVMLFQFNQANAHRFPFVFLICCDEFGDLGLETIYGSFIFFALVDLIVICILSICTLCNGTLGCRSFLPG